MNSFLIIIIVFSIINVFAQNKFMELTFSYKLLSVSLLIQLWINSNISRSEVFIGISIVYLTSILLISINNPKMKNVDMEIDRK